MKVLYIFLGIVFFLNTANAENTIFSYENEYKGIKVGQSTLADVIDNFGKPSNKKLYRSVVKYYFDDFEVTVSDHTGRLKVIAVWKESYVDKNGIEIGALRDVVENLIKYKISRGTSISDLKNGVVYHFDKNNKVKKIALASEFAVKPKYKKFWEPLLKKNKE